MYTNIAMSTPVLQWLLEKADRKATKALWLLRISSTTLLYHTNSKCIKRIQYVLIIQFLMLSVRITGPVDALLVHLLIPLWKSTTALSAMPHLVSAWNELSKELHQPVDDESCHLIFLSPVHHHHRHYHHFHYAWILWPFPDLIAHGFFLLFCSFHLFVWFVWETKLILSAFELHVKSLHFPFLSFPLCIGVS